MRGDAKTNPCNHFGLDKVSLKVSVDDTSGLWGE